MRSPETFCSGGKFAAVALVALFVSFFFGILSSAVVVADPGVVYGFWSKQGIVLEPVGGDWTCVCEPTVIYEGSPQILTEEPNVFKMWYRETSMSPLDARICYAESVDGINWTKYGGNPILSDETERYWQPFVLKHDGTYYLYVNVDQPTPHFDRYYSANGINWTRDKQNALQPGTSGQWDDSGFGNLFVWVEGTNDWKMLYEAHNGGPPWKIGLATSTDGQNWDKHGDNPVLQDTGSCGGPEVHKVGSIYYMWYHNSPSGWLPSDICRASSTNLTEWTKYGGSNYPVFWRTEDYEGVGRSDSQVADACIIEVNGTTYSFYAAVVDQNPPPDQCLALAKSDLTIAQLVLTAEMGGTGEEPSCLLEISPESGIIGTQVTFTGSDFTPDAAVNIYYLVNTEWIMKISTTDSSGCFTSDPYDIDNLHGSDIQFIALDYTTMIWSNVVHFIVEDISLPHIEISPTSGSTNVSVTITGTFFTPNCSVSIFNQGWRVELIVADDDGKFTTFFTIPANTPLGSSQFIAFDHVSDRFSNEVFYTITSQEGINPILSISPTAGRDNIPITFTGSGFTLGGLVQIATRDSTGLIVTIAAQFADNTGAFEITMNPWSVLGIAGGGHYLNFHALDVATGVMSNEVIFTRTGVLPTEGPAGSLVDLFLPFTGGDVATAGYLVGTLFFVTPLTIIGLAVVAAAKARQYAGLTVFGFFLLSVFICVMTSLFPWWFLVMIIAIVSLVFARGWFGRE